MGAPPLVEPDEVLRILAGFNPWWRGSAAGSIPSFQRLAYHACRNRLGDPSFHRALLLSGPRRVGKTTILLQLARSLLDTGVSGTAADPKSVLYLSLDHPILKLLGLSKTLDLYHQAIWPEGRPAHLLLDEVQYSKDWETEIKLLVDHKREYRIVATGSASVVHKERLAETGVGRWLTIPVPTLSFYEFLHIRGESVPRINPELRPAELLSLSASDRLAITSNLRALLPAFQRYLLVGGFPETALQEDVSLCQRLLREDVVERVLKRDMTALFGVRNVDDLERLFIYLCMHTGGILSHQTIASTLNVSHITVGNHLRFLEQANLVYRLPPVEFGGRKVLKARNKYYLVDAALRNATLLRGEDVIGNSQEMGVIVETTVLRHLFAYYYRDTPQIGYWRNAKTEHEVDIIIQSPRYVIAVDVKYRERSAPGPGLSEFLADREGSRFGYVVTKADEDFGPSELPSKVTALRVPAHVLTYLLGQAERLLWKS